MQEKFWRVSDLLSLADADRAKEGASLYENLINNKQVMPHIEKEILELPQTAKSGKNQYRRHWVSTTQAIAILATVYPIAELAAITLGAAIATQQIESKGIELI